jgi:2-methylfumaryl-CoA isomerase
MRLALSDIAFATVSHLGHIAEAELLGSERASIGNDLYGAFGRDFVTEDGRRIMVVALSHRQWSALVGACGIGEAISAIEAATGLNFRDEKERFEARDLISGLIARWCAARSFAAIGAIFEAHGVCWGPYQSFVELVRDDPRCSSANPIFQTITTAGVGRHLAAGFPTRMIGLAREEVVPAPLIGEHTDEILAETLGLPGPAIGRLHDSGVVSGPMKQATHA